MTRVIRLAVFSIFALISLSAAKEKILPIALTEATWGEMLEGEWMVEFYAPWCPACRQLTETWEKFSSWSQDLDIKIAKVDVTENPGLSGRFLIFALPTIYHVKDGIFRQYTGPREENGFISFVDDRKWEKIEPVAWWKSPSSPQMGIVSVFFRMAMVVKSTFNLLTEDYGYPVWAAYVLFAVCTVVTGLLLGLMLVCCCDVLFPPRYSERVHTTSDEPAKEKDSDDEESEKEEDGSDTAEDGAGEGDKPATRRRKPRKD